MGSGKIRVQNINLALPQEDSGLFLLLVTVIFRLHEQVYPLIPLANFSCPLVDYCKLPLVKSSGLFPLHVGVQAMCAAFESQIPFPGSSHALSDA